MVQTFMLRYFIQRTGVYANDCIRMYLDQELTEAKSDRKCFSMVFVIRFDPFFLDQRSNNQSLEDNYLVRRYI